MRILFAVTHMGFLRNFESTLRMLCDRGHDVHVSFEGGTKYSLPAGLPDTPDGFGRTQAVDFGAATAVMFTSDGTCIDQTGNPVNGTIFVGLPGRPLSARAITILGGTGRVRGYRWNGQKWVGL